MSVDVSEVASDQPRPVSVSPSPTQDHGSSSSSSMVVNDIALWKRKQWSAGVMVGSTAIWTLLEVYQFHLISLVCWAAMAFLTFLFLQGNILRLTQRPDDEVVGEEIAEGEKLAKSREDKLTKKDGGVGGGGVWRLRSRWEVTEEDMNRVTRGLIGQVEDTIRWMFRVSAAQQTRRDWLRLAGVISGLFLVGYMGRFFDFITMLYIGVIMGMILPVTYMKNERRIKEYGDRIRVQSRRVYEALDDKVFKKVNRQVSMAFQSSSGRQKKQKKME